MKKRSMLASVFLYLVAKASQWTSVGKQLVGNTGREGVLTGGSFMRSTAAGKSAFFLLGALIAVVH
jgi:hypothetical protein